MWRFDASSRGGRSSRAEPHWMPEQVMNVNTDVSAAALERRLCPNFPSVDPYLRAEAGLSAIVCDNLLSIISLLVSMLGPSNEAKV